jgi:expansin (peptidoglycan-binding protein)
MRWFGWLLASFLMVAACSDASESTDGPQLRRGQTSRVADAGSSEMLEAGVAKQNDAGTTSTTPHDAGTTTPYEGPEESGEATYYAATGGAGACGIDAPDDYMVAALNGDQYSAANCGKCASVKGPSGTVVVKIWDKCPGCSSGDLDLSEQAFQKIANLSAGRVKISWHFVDCPADL